VWGICRDRGLATGCKFQQGFVDYAGPRSPLRFDMFPGSRAAPTSTVREKMTPTDRHDWLSGRHFQIYPRKPDV